LEFFDQLTVHSSPFAAGQLTISSDFVDPAVEGRSHSANSRPSQVGTGVDSLIDSSVAGPEVDVATLDFRRNPLNSPFFFFNSPSALPLREELFTKLDLREPISLDMLGRRESILLLLE
jgi:hypothetical protein